MHSAAGHDPPTLAHMPAAIPAARHGWPSPVQKGCLLPHPALPRPWPASARVGPLAHTRSSAGTSAGISAGPRGGPMLRARCSERTRTVAPPAWQGSRAAAFSGRETRKGRQQLDRRLTRRTRYSISLTNEPGRWRTTIAAVGRAGACGAGARSPGVRGRAAGRYARARFQPGRPGRPAGGSREPASRGKPLVLVFSDPNCGPCMTPLPDLGRWQREYRDKLMLVPISRGTSEDNRIKLAEHGLTPWSPSASAC
jgi:thiol-disulfide isomerase/thioredoxin